MIDLKDQVTASASELQKLWTKLSRRGQTILPLECYTRWEKLASHYSLLEGTIPLFDIRNKAWQIVESLVDEKRIQFEKKREKAPSQSLSSVSYNFSHDGIEMDFASARHLALVSYMSVTWSIYDRLTNVCGRVAATDDVLQHPKQNPKLVEDLLAKSKEKLKQADTVSQMPRNPNEYGPQLLAFSMQHHIRAAFDWPTRVSYAIRNWLIHEGQSMGALRLFIGDGIEDGLLLHGECIDYIEKNCKVDWDDKGEPSRCCLKGSDNPWKRDQNKDLLKILNLYHAEIDAMIAGLLKWCIESLIGQLTIFSDRDKMGHNRDAKFDQHK